MSSGAIIGLLTDFGTRDSYVAQMKGVIVSRCDARIIDLTHEIPAFDVFAAGMFLREAAPRFEPIDMRPIVLIAVVDPGVGTDRKILAAENQGRIFLAPDNGLLSVVLDGEPLIVEVTNSAHFLPTGSNTFHGRDRFAPVAAAIACGALITELGPPVPRADIIDLGYTPPDLQGDPIGTVVRIDRFGNVVTDLDASKLGEYSSVLVRQVELSNRAKTYAEKKGSSDAFIIVGSMGTLEISIANGSAAEKLGVAIHDRVKVIR